MKNLLKKTISLLTALSMLLCAAFVFAEGTAGIPAFEVGSGISGELRPDSVTEIMAYAPRGGEMRFTLSLAEDCGVTVAIDGVGVALYRPDGGLPVYLFSWAFAQDECHVISMTADWPVAYSLSSALPPEEPAPEVQPEAMTEADPAPVAEPEVQPAEEPQEQPAEIPEEQPEEDPVLEPAEEPEKESPKELDEPSDEEQPE